MRRFLPLLVLTAFLTACRSEPPLAPLPEGPQTLTGTVMPAVVSTAHRGTHLLEQQGKAVAYLESTTVNLREFQSRSTVLRGHFERNIDPADLPVLIVDGVESAEAAMRPWYSATLRMSADIPLPWGETGSGDAIAFIPAGSLRPIIELKPVEEAPMPSGVALSVGRGNAIRFLDDISGEQRIAVARGNGYIEIAYTPQGQSDPQSFRPDWLAFLRSLKIEGATAPSSSRSQGGMSSSASGEKEGQPCGGVAGILCPSGQYCEITDLEQNIGVCRKML